MRRSSRRLLAWTVGGLAGLILAAYLLLAAGLKLSAWDLKAAAEGSERSLASPSVVRERKSVHSFTLLNNGLSSLAARLALIRGARQSIELEFFIYDLDFSARWITSKLVARAKAGVKVRLPVDFAGPVFQLRPEYAELLRRHHWREKCRG